MQRRRKWIIVWMVLIKPPAGGAARCRGRVHLTARPAARHVPADAPRAHRVEGIAKRADPADDPHDLGRLPVVANARDGAERERRHGDGRGGVKVYVPMYALSVFSVATLIFVCCLVVGQPPPV